MTRMLIPFLGILCIAATPLAAQQATPPQDVTITNAIRPADPLPCQLDPDKIASAASDLTVAGVTKLTGCEARKLSSFEMLGQTTEVFEFRDGVNRLQVTMRNSKVVSHTFRKL
jgi:hypothetical protein